MGLAVESSKNDEGERDRWECKEGFRDMTRAFFRPITRITVEAQTLGIVRWNGLAGVGLSSSTFLIRGKGTPGTSGIWSVTSAMFV